MPEFQRLSRARLRQLQQLKQAKGRRAQQAFLLDGAKLVRDALQAGAPVRALYSRTPELWLEHGLPVTALSQADAERLSALKTPQGHFALVADQLTAPSPPEAAQWTIAALDAVQDAGNAGAIIRAAAAFGAAAVLSGPGSADPTHPRATRAATGAWFQVQQWRSTDLAADLQALRSSGATVLAADAAGVSLQQAPASEKTVWLFGNEGGGIRAELEDVIDGRVAVPMADGLESLNVSVAAGIILHHHYQHILAAAAKERA